MTAASPQKLKNGSWGARVRSETVAIGDVVTITTRAGKSWDATVSRVLWSGDGVAICATESRRSITDAPRAGRSSSGCRYCRPTATRTAQIWEECEHCGSEPVYM